MAFIARPASPEDAESITRIYNQGIRDRVATFETRERSVDEVRAWFDGTRVIVVVDENGTVVAFASTSRYFPRDCYAGIAEFSVYVDRDWRGRGAGLVAMEALIAAARDRGYWKLTSRVFVENLASRSLLKKVGFREVGVHEKHARLDGVWRDVVVVERLIPENQREASSDR
jgi:L-amino acid N-acyltransferase YncA